MDKSTVYSVSQLSSLVEAGFQQLFDEFLFWCRAEVGVIKKYGSRYYIDLFEYDGAGAVKAKITGIVWNAAVLETFLEKAGQTTKTLQGKEVMVQGYVSFSVKWGLSVSILGFSHEFETGRQVTALETLIASLKKAGVYKKNTEKMLPVYPQRLAVVSSPQSQGLRDFLSVLEESPFTYEYELFESFVEGDKAIGSIAEAFGLIEEQLAAGKAYDCIALLRGGGGKEGFMWQNSEPVAYSVCTASLPVLVGVGHTSDTSLLDTLAYKTFKTPTEVATHLVQLYAEHCHTIQTFYNEISLAGTQVVRDFSDAVDRYFENIMLMHMDTVLDKGYALVMQSGDMLSSGKIAGLMPGESIEIRTKTATIEAQVTGVTTLPS